MQTTISQVPASRSGTGVAKPLMGGVLIKPAQFIRITPMPAWQETIVSRTYGRLARFIGDYRHYRGKGFKSKAAWYLASMTLP
jgi:hypothetical protein